MSTATLEPEPAVGPAVNPVTAYRQTVLSGEYDLSTCESACRLASEWQADRRTYEARLAARESLDGRVLELEAAAKAAEAKAAAAVPQPMDSMTLADVRAIIREIVPGFRTDTWEGLAAGCRMLPEQPLQLQATAMRARTDASFTRQKAESLLFQTAAAMPRDSESDKLRHEIASIQTRIAGRQHVLDSDRLVMACRCAVHAVVTGEISVETEWRRLGFAGCPRGHQADEQNKRLLDNAKAELADAMTLAKGRKKAVAENERDEAELQRLNERLQAVEQQQRAWQMVPENLRWCE